MLTIILHGWDSDLNTVVEELHEKENTAEYLNNSYK